MSILVVVVLPPTKVVMVGSPVFVGVFLGILLRLANLAEMPVVVSAKSLRCCSVGYHVLGKNCYHCPLLCMTSITLYARTNARSTSDEDVSSHKVSTVFQIFSNDASALL